MEKGFKSALQKSFKAEYMTFSQFLAWKQKKGATPDEVIGDHWGQFGEAGLAKLLVLTL